MRITIDTLIEMKACGWQDRTEQIGLFAATFPDGCDLTRENIATALAAGLDVGWFAKKILPQSALTEYRCVQQSALTEYRCVQQPAWAEYERVEQPALAEYERVQQSALAEYERVEQPALAEYRRVQQSALAEILCKYVK